MSCFVKIGMPADFGVRPPAPPPKTEPAAISTTKSYPSSTRLLANKSFVPVTYDSQRSHKRERRARMHGKQRYIESPPPAASFPPFQLRTAYEGKRKCAENVLVRMGRLGPACTRAAITGMHSSTHRLVPASLYAVRMATLLIYSSYVQKRSFTAFLQRE